MSEKLMDRVSEIFDGIAASNESENPKTEVAEEEKKVESGTRNIPPNHELSDKDINAITDAIMKSEDGLDEDEDDVINKDVKRLKSYLRKGLERDEDVLEHLKENVKMAEHGSMIEAYSSLAKKQIEATKTIVELELQKERTKLTRTTRQGYVSGRIPENLTNEKLQLKAGEKITSLEELNDG